MLVSVARQLCSHAPAGAVTGLVGWQLGPAGVSKGCCRPCSACQLTSQRGLSCWKTVESESQAPSGWALDRLKSQTWAAGAQAEWLNMLCMEMQTKNSFSSGVEN